MKPERQLHLSPPSLSLTGRGLFLRLSRSPDHQFRDEAFVLAAAAAASLSGSVSSCSLYVLRYNEVSHCEKRGDLTALFVLLDLAVEAVVDVVTSSSSSPL